MAESSEMPFPEDYELKLNQSVTGEAGSLSEKSDKETELYTRSLFVNSQHEEDENNNKDEEEDDGIIDFSDWD